MPQTKPASQPARALPFELYRAILADVDTRTVVRCRTMNRQLLAVADDVLQKRPVKKLRAIAAADTSAYRADIAREDSIISEARGTQDRVQRSMAADRHQMRVLEDAMLVHVKMTASASPYASDLERAILSLAPANLDAAQGVRVNAQHHEKSWLLSSLIERWSGHAHVVIPLQQAYYAAVSKEDAAIYRRSMRISAHTNTYARTDPMWVGGNPRR